MAIEVNCPSCETKFVLDDILQGKRVRCKRCEAEFTANGGQVQAKPGAPRSALRSGDTLKTSKGPAKSRPQVRKPAPKSNVGLLAAGLGAMVVIPVVCSGVALGGWLLYRARSSDDAPATASTLNPIKTDKPANTQKPANGPKIENIIFKQPDQPRPEPEKPKRKVVYGPEQSVKICVVGFDPKTWDKYQAWFKGTAAIATPEMEVLQSGDCKWITLTPVGKNLDVYSKKLTPFSTVTALHKDLRVIYVELKPQAIAKDNPAEQPNPVVIPDPPKLSPVEAALKDMTNDNAGMQEQAVRTLDGLTPDDMSKAKVTAALKDLIKRRPWFGGQRGTAVHALGIWGGKDEVPFLITLLDHEDRSVKTETIMLLGKFKDARAAGPMAKLLADRDQRGRVSESLKAMGEEAEKPVLEQLQSADLGVKLEVCKILKVIGTKESWPALKEAADLDNQELANAAREALPEKERPKVYGPETSVRICVNGFDPNTWDRYQARFKATSIIAKPKMHVSQSGNVKWITLNPVGEDLDLFAKKLLPFTKIVAIHKNQRLIYVELKR